ncbi:MAG: SET domain-containing protein-lysine N-methyltransferase, partial [Actinomycetota bacterium]
KMKDGFELRETEGRGEGIFATRSFKARETVMVGIIEKVLDGNHSHASQTGENKYVLHAGSISKVNHSCDPNCGISVNETGAHDFVAMRDIIVNEEITFDYAMRNYGVNYFPKQCMCGSKGCRGKITGWKDLPDERKKIYKGFIAPYLLELDAKSK